MWKTYENIRNKPVDIPKCKSVGYNSQVISIVIHTLINRFFHNNNIKIEKKKRIAYIRISNPLVENYYIYTGLIFTCIINSIIIESVSV